MLLAAATVTGQALLAIAFVFAARWSNPADLGMLVTAMALGATVNGIADFGATTLWVREVAGRRMTPDRLSSLMVSKSIILFGVFAFVSLISYLLAPPGTIYWVSGILGYSVMIHQMLQVPLRGNARGDLASIVVFVDRLAVFVLFLLIQWIVNNAIVSLTIGLIFGPLVAAVVARQITPIKARGSLSAFSFHNPWKGSRTFGFTNIVLSSQSMDSPILTLTGGAAATGIYGAVNKWTQPMSIVSGAFTSATAPYLAKTMGLRNVLHEIKGSLWIPIAGCIVAILIAALSETIVEFLLGPEYTSAAIVLCVLALASIPGIANTFLLTMFQYSGRDNAAFWVIFSAVSTQLTLVCFLGPSLGPLAAALGLVANQVVQSLLFASILLKSFMTRGLVARHKAT